MKAVWVLALEIINSLPFWSLGFISVPQLVPLLPLHSRTMIVLFSPAASKVPLSISLSKRAVMIALVHAKLLEVSVQSLALAGLSGVEGDGLGKRRSLQLFKARLHSSTTCGGAGGSQTHSLLQTGLSAGQNAAFGLHSPAVLLSLQ